MLRCEEHALWCESKRKGRAVCGKTVDARASGCSMRCAGNRMRWKAVTWVRFKYCARQAHDVKIRVSVRCCMVCADQQITSNITLLPPYIPSTLCDILRQ